MYIVLHDLVHTHNKGGLEQMYMLYLKVLLYTKCMQAGMEGQKCLFFVYVLIGYLIGNLQSMICANEIYVTRN